MQKKRHTIFSTPVLNSLLRALCWLALRLRGWKVVGQRPEQDKYVLICAPHTSNWDFPIMLAVAFVLRLDVHWMGKHTLFPWYAGWLMRYLGGVPIDRRAAQNTVEQMVAVFNNSEQMVLVITPEGTRGKVEQWKGGFYHIAQGAGVPVVLGFVDTSKMETGICAIHHPAGDFETDLPVIQAHYRGKQGFRPELG